MIFNNYLDKIWKTSEKYLTQSLTKQEISSLKKEIEAGKNAIKCRFPG